MKKLIALALLLTLVLSLNACCINIPQEDAALDDYDHEEDSYQQPEQKEEEVEDRYAYVWEDFQAVTVEGEGSVNMYAINRSMEFSLPNEVRHYTEMRQSSPGIVMIVHDTRASVSGRTTIEFREGIVEEFVKFYVEQMNGSMENAVPYSHNGYEGMLWKGHEEEDWGGGITGNYDSYIAAVDVGNGQIIGICIDACWRSGRTCELTEDTIGVILDHCTILD